MAGNRGARPAVLVVGSANIDIVVPVERLPAPGETVLGGERLEFWGGKGANQAVAASRAGGEVRLVCMTGDDGAGAAYRRRLIEEGVSRRGLLRAKSPTGTALIVVDERGENQIAVSPGANLKLTPGRLRRERAILDFGDVALAQLEVPQKSVVAAFGHARRRGARTILNPAPMAGGLPPELLPLVDVLVPNEAEAGYLAGLGDGAGGREGQKRGVSAEENLVRLARCLRSMGPPAVVLTAGERGALFFSDDEAGWARPPDGIRAVDTTGAGDAFCGALAVRMAEGMGLSEAVAFAVSAAALSVRRAGAQKGLPGRRAIMRNRKKVCVEPICEG